VDPSDRCHLLAIDWAGDSETEPRFGAYSPGAANRPGIEDQLSKIRGVPHFLRSGRAPRHTADPGTCEVDPRAEIPPHLARRSPIQISRDVATAGSIEETR